MGRYGGCARLVGSKVLTHGPIIASTSEITTRMHYDKRMIDKLIYLHIPKSGGTSQRLAFYDVYGEENVFWHGIDNDSDGSNYTNDQLEDFTVVGGHRPISYYPSDLRALYVSVVREPISRAVSLYSYYAKPDFAEPHFVKARKKVFRLWQERGLDSESLVNSLEKCPEFRREVQNFQCRYLSRYENSFQGVMKTLEDNDAIIADVGSTAKMNSYLSSLLEWGAFRERRANRSLEDTHELILQEAGAAEALGELLGEDELLYDYVVNEHQGLYRPAAADSSSYAAIRPEKPADLNPDDELPWKQVQVYSKGFIGLGAGGSGQLGVAIMNHSEEDINYRKYPGLSICYGAFDKCGGTLDGSITTRPLLIPLRSQGNTTLSLEVNIPPEFLSKAAGIRVWLEIAPDQPLTAYNPLHLASAQIFPQPGT